MDHNEQYIEAHVPELNSLAIKSSEFIQCLNHGRDPPSTVEHGRQGIQFIKEMDRQSDKGVEIVLQ